MNKNPYDVLGISPNASDDEVKRAYRDLTRKYHPDANVNNPLADLAEEKFKEVQEAYDMIMKQREQGGYNYGYGSQGFIFRGAAESPDAVRIQLSEREAVQGGIECAVRDSQPDCGVVLFKRSGQRRDRQQHHGAGPCRSGSEYGAQ